MINTKLLLLVIPPQIIMIFWKEVQLLLGQNHWISENSSKACDDIILLNVVKSWQLMIFKRLFHPDLKKKKHLHVLRRHLLLLILFPFSLNGQIFILIFQFNYSTEILLHTRHRRIQQLKGILLLLLLSRTKIFETISIPFEEFLVDATYTHDKLE